jgi:hypothetical protein
MFSQLYIKQQQMSLVQSAAIPKPVLYDALLNIVDAAKIIENTQLIHLFASCVTVDQFQALQAHPIHISLNIFLEWQSGLLLGCCKN